MTVVKLRIGERKNKGNLRWALEGVCHLLLLALGLYYLGVNEMTEPANSFSPFLAHIFPTLAETDQITVCAGQLIAGAVLVLIGLMILFRTRLHRLN